jgi:hypothetical protein
VRDAQRGLVEHEIGSRHHAIDTLGVANIALYEGEPPRGHRSLQVLVAAAHEVVDYAYFVYTRCEQLVDYVRSDETGTARDQHPRAAKIKGHIRTPQRDLRHPP